LRLSFRTKEEVLALPLEKHDAHIEMKGGRTVVSSPDDSAHNLLRMHHISFHGWFFYRDRLQYISQQRNDRTTQAGSFLARRFSYYFVSAFQPSHQ